MRRERVVRPMALEVLESRVVPSQQGVVISALVTQNSNPILIQIQANRDVRMAFHDFLQTYVDDIATILLAPGPDGMIRPSANRAAFDAKVAVDLDVLSSRVTSSLQAAAAPAELIVRAREAINGSDPNSLLNQLLALPTPTGTVVQGPSIRVFTAASTQAANALSESLRAELLATGARPVRQAAPSPLTLAPGGTSSVNVTVPFLASREVRSAFTRFLQNFSRAVTTELFARGADGAIEPAANRAAYDAQVAAALKSLNDDVARALGRLPSGAALAARAGSLIQGDAPTSLRNRLAALPTPDTAEAQAVRLFTLDAFPSIGQVLAEVSALATGGRGAR